MAKADLEEFYELVAVGDTVKLVGQRNEETAQLFGADQAPAAAAQPTLVTKAEPAAATVEVASIATDQAAAHAATRIAAVR
jgi:hypothetical protein